MSTTENAERSKDRPRARTDSTPIREVFVGTPLPGKGQSAAARAARIPTPAGRWRPKCLGGPEIDVTKRQGPARALFEWMRSPDNPFFARSFVNRVWGHYFGVGIVDPVDDFSLANPPSNPKLLDALAKDFIDRKYDIRRLERTVLLSRTYQLTSDTNATNQLDRNNYSHSYVRPMMAEVVVDVLNAALGRQGELRQGRGRRRRAGHRGRLEPGAERQPELRLPHLRPAAADHGLRLRAGDGAGPAAEAVPDGRSERCWRRSAAQNGPPASSCSPTQEDDDEVTGGAVPGHADAPAQRQGTRHCSPIIEAGTRIARRRSPTRCGR